MNCNLRRRCLLWLFGSLVAAAHVWGADPEFFYYYRGAKRALNLDESGVAVKLATQANRAGDVDPSAASGFAGRGAALGYKTTDAKPFRHGGWLKLEIKSAVEKLGGGQTMTRKQTQKRIIDDVAKLADAEFVSPIFRDALGDPVSFEPTILIGFKDGVDESAQSAILQKIKHVKSMRRQPGPKAKWIVMTNYRNGIDLLDAVNEIAALPQVRYAEPNTIFTAEVR